jgi:hypothetical protein
VPAFGIRTICVGEGLGFTALVDGDELELDDPMQPLAIITAAATNAPAERAIATLDTSIASEVPRSRFWGEAKEGEVPERDDYITEFRKAAANFVSAEIAFHNAVIAARKAGISDQELARIAGLKESEVSAIPDRH